jgi:hypothetical protein
MFGGQNRHIFQPQKKYLNLKDPQTLNKQAFEVGIFSVAAQGGVGGDSGAWPIALGPQIITY